MRLVNGMPPFMNKHFNERGLRLVKRRRQFTVAGYASDPLVPSPVSGPRNGMQQRADMQRKFRRRCP